MPRLRAKPWGGRSSWNGGSRWALRSAGLAASVARVERSMDRSTEARTSFWCMLAGVPYVDTVPVRHKPLAHTSSTSHCTLSDTPTPIVLASCSNKLPECRA